jgi:excinuclease ABC subunit A
VDQIQIRGAEENNLRGIDLDLPRDALIVITGVSGSGKSSLAYDTIYQEGQRRFMESLSAYARQFLGQLDKPRVERVDGLSPTLSIDQKTVNRNPRSTVGTVTEILDHLRLLMARLGTPRCPLCSTEITTLSAAGIADRLLQDAPEARLHVMAPIVWDRKGEYRKELKQALEDGFIRARIDGEVRSLEEDITLARYEKHTIELVVDRLKLKADRRDRLVEAVETALALGGGMMTALVEDQHQTFSALRACPEHGIAVPEMEPRLFSFNAPQGACETCEGLGFLEDFDEDLLLDGAAPILDALRPLNGDERLPFTTLSRPTLAVVCTKLGIDTSTLWDQLTADETEALLNGAEVYYEVVREKDYASGKRTARSNRVWAGILPMVRRSYKWSKMKRLAACRRHVQCPACEGKRLNPIALAVDFRDQRITDLVQMTISVAREFFGSLQLAEGAETALGTPIVREICTRLDFLDQVGLGYLSLDRSAATLSGGEAQRIRLASQVGAGLQGVTYVLDEPSIGLHPRDLTHLLDALCALRDKGNTIIVVEHDT